MSKNIYTLIKKHFIAKKKKKAPKNKKLEKKKKKKEKKKKPTQYLYSEIKQRAIKLGVPIRQNVVA